jgi:cell surface protein SprA
LLNNNEIATSSSGFNVSVSEGQDYSKLENAKLNLMNTFDPNGLYFLATRLANDEVLAVAYQYTMGIKYTKWESLGMTVLMQRL